jgi:hypothetical protein
VTKRRMGLPGTYRRAREVQLPRRSAAGYVETWKGDVP